MGKLKELMDEYKRAPFGSPAEKEAREGIEKIVEWMRENGHLTSEFKLPEKKRKTKMFGYYPEHGWKHYGNFIIHESDKETITLLTNYNKGL